METKEIKINIPDGYEIDKENSTFECIKFKKIECKFPMSWKEYLHNLKGRDYFYLCSSGGVTSATHYKESISPSAFESPNKEEVLAFNAFGKLIQLRNAWWKADNNWRPNWTNSNAKYCIVRVSSNIGKDDLIGYQMNFCFRTPEIRDKFLETFKDLIEEAKEFI